MWAGAHATGPRVQAASKGASHTQTPRAAPEPCAHRGGHQVAALLLRALRLLAGHGPPQVSLCELEERVVLGAHAPRAGAAVRRRLGGAREHVHAPPKQRD